MQIVRFIAKCVGCDKWIAVNLTRFICIVIMRQMRKEFNFHTCMLEEHYSTNCNCDTLFIKIEKFCHSFGCCFLRNSSRKLNSVHVVLLVPYSSHLDVLLTACYIYFT